jgi:hypothetical protein
MLSLFSPEKPRESPEAARSLPPEMRQLIVDLHAEFPTMLGQRNGRYVLHSLRQKAFPSQRTTDRGLRASSLTQSQALPADGEMIPDPAERTLAWLQQCRAILIRYDKQPGNSLGLIQLACARRRYRWLHRARKVQTL